LTSDLPGSNKIYAANTDGRLYAVNKDTGKSRWSFKTQQPIRLSSPVISEDIVFVSSEDGNIYAVEKFDAM